MTHSPESPYTSSAPVEGEPMDEELAHILGDDLTSDPDLAPEDIEGFLRDTHDRIEKETGIRGWLRSRPTSVRMAMAAAVVVGLTVTIGIVRTPKLLDFTLVFHLAALAALAAVALFVGLRPLQARPLAPAILYGTLAMLVLVPIALAFHGPDVAAVTGGESARSIGKCFAVGSLIALPLALLVGSLSRGGSFLSAVALAAAAGLGGNVWLEAHCPVPGAAHVVGGHVTVIVMYAALTALGLWFGFGRTKAGTRQDPRKLP